MNLICHNGEAVLKSFECASKKGGTNIVVTNKRLLASVREKNSISQKEIYLSDVKSFECRHLKYRGLGRLIAGLFFLIYGIMAVALSFVSYYMAKKQGGDASLLETMSDIYTIIRIAGVALIILGILLLLKKKSFTLKITLRGGLGGGLGAGSATNPLHTTHIPFVRIILSVFFAAYFSVFLFMDGVPPFIKSFYIVFLALFLLLMWKPYIKSALGLLKGKKITPVVKVKNGPKICISLENAKILANELGALLVN